MRKYLLISVVVTTILAFVWAFNFPFNHPPSYEVDGFEYIEQPDNITCGPTSTLMLLKRYGKDYTLDEVKDSTKTQWLTYNDQPIGMTSPEYLPIAMTKMGLPSLMLRGDLKRLKYYISQRRPVIVLLRSGELTWHYVVVIGYTEDVIVVADPGWGQRVEMPVENFLGSWSFKTDMRGNECGHESLVFLLKAAEVRSHTMIVPWNSLDGG